MNGNDINEQIYYSVWRSVCDVVGNSVRDSIYNSVVYSVNNSVGYSVWRLVNNTIKEYEWD